VFEIVVYDYAEVWVNGKAPFVLGQNGVTVTAGWNAPNRVVLTRNAQPGETFQIAVFVINGPVSTHPDTFIWVRSATLDFYKPGKLSKARKVKLDVDKKDAALTHFCQGTQSWKNWPMVSPSPKGRSGSRPTIRRLLLIRTRAFCFSVIPITISFTG
jgi:hypothetical protein